MNDFLTLKSENSGEFSEKRSRFIGYASPVKNENGALNFINKIRSLNRDATHNVWAYILKEGDIKRYSDDGEPQGTAGVPILDVLIKENLFNSCIVVTRYFGGVLLGAGGLARAYSKSAKIAVNASGIIKMTLCSVIDSRCDYNFYGSLTKIIARYNGKALDSDFGEDVNVKFFVPKEHEEKVKAEIFDKSFGKCESKSSGEIYKEI